MQFNFGTRDCVRVTQIEVFPSTSIHHDVISMLFFLFLLIFVVIFRRHDEANHAVLLQV